MATRRWSSKAIWMRSGSLRSSIRWVLLVSGRFSVSKTIIPEAGSTFSSLHHADTFIVSVDWSLGVIFMLTGNMGVGPWWLGWVGRYY